MPSDHEPRNTQEARELNDDQRQAASIKASISTYVATAALAVLAGTLALFTYITQNFVPPLGFYVLMGLTAAALVVSIMLGGDGQAKTVSLVAKSTWTNKAIWQFNWQAVLTLIALGLLVAATAVGATARKSVPLSSSVGCVTYLVRLDQLVDDEHPDATVQSIISQDSRTKACGLSPNLGEVLRLLSRH